MTALGPKLSIAIVVADHHTGDIIASVGSAGLLEDARAGHIDMTRGIRSPGSTLKPLIYGLAFEDGLAHPSSLIEDRPTGFGGYAPQNFDGAYRGTVTIREALAQSLNVPAIVVLDAVGPARLVARLKRAGVIAGIAATVGAGAGRRPRRRRRQPARSGPALCRDRPGRHAGDAARRRSATRPTCPLAKSGPPVLSPVAAWQVADILAGVPPPSNGSPGLVAYKTGTSYGYRDAWAIGFDGRNVIGVWIGRPDGTPVPGLSGITSAAPVLFEAFNRLGPRRGAAAPADRRAF